MAPLNWMGKNGHKELALHTMIEMDDLKFLNMHAVTAYVIYLSFYLRFFSCVEFKSVVSAANKIEKELACCTSSWDKG